MGIRIWEAAGERSRPWSEGASGLGNNEESPVVLERMRSGPWGCRKDRQQQQINLRIYFRHWWQPQILAVSSKFQMEKKKRQELYNSRHNKIFSEKSPHPSPRSWEKHCEGVLIVWRDPEGRQEVLCKALQPGDLSRALVYKTETSPGAISLSQQASRNQKAV